jgi:SAM-dependent methyltransferase
MQSVEQWEAGEQSWWQSHYAAKAPHNGHYQGSLLRPQGFRHYHRAKLFSAILPRLMALPDSKRIWIDIGAGDSYTIGDLIPRNQFDYTYIATDISAVALARGRDHAGSSPVLHAASAVPFARHSAAVVSGLGVLHHFPTWQDTLATMVDMLVPGGYLLLHEVIDKPRIGNRDSNLFAAHESPHEGQVGAMQLRTIVEETCEVMVWETSMTPLVVGLSVALKLDKFCLRSYPLTLMTIMLDELWANTIGQMHPSLSTREVYIIARKS